MPSSRQYEDQAHLHESGRLPTESTPLEQPIYDSPTQAIAHHQTLGKSCKALAEGNRNAADALTRGDLKEAAKCLKRVATAHDAIARAHAERVDQLSAISAANGTTPSQLGVQRVASSFFEKFLYGDSSQHPSGGIFHSRPIDRSQEDEFLEPVERRLFQSR